MFDGCLLLRVGVRRVGRWAGAGDGVVSGHRVRAYRTARAVLGVLAGLGMRGVMVSPGSRSAPLAVVADAMAGLAVRVVLDERSAGFAALGMAAASGRMTGLICTSGTAGAHYLPAVMEANRARVPMAVLTADRPPGFLERDAPQTVDQARLFGSQVRAFLGLPAAHLAQEGEVVRLVGEAARAGLPPCAGPVHVNLPFAKPLEPPPDWPPVSLARSVPQTRPEEPAPPAPESAEALAGFVGEGRRGVMVVGPRRTGPAERAALAAWAEEAGWPLVADPLSGLRTGRRRGVISAGEMLAGDERFASAHRPQAVIRAGGTPTGRRLQQWLESLECPQLILDPDRWWTAPGPETVLRDPIPGLLAAVAPPGRNRSWAAAWREAEEEAAARRREERRLHPDTEPALVAAIAERGGTVWAAGSMPVRHLDLMMEAGWSAEAMGNRGACGIDGSIASAAGAALGGGRRVTAVAGDSAFLHDLGSAAAAVGLGAELTVVVLDNGGGAIFGLLPIAETPGVDFERLFTAPHGLDLAAAASGLGAQVRRTAAAELPGALAEAEREGGVWVLVVKTDPGRMRAVYRRLADGR